MLTGLQSRRVESQGAWEKAPAHVYSSPPQSLCRPNSPSPELAIGSPQDVLAHRTASVDLLKAVPSLLPPSGSAAGGWPCPFLPGMTTALRLPPGSRSSRAQRVQGTTRVLATEARGGGGSVRYQPPQPPPSPRPGRSRLPVRVLVSPGGRSRWRSVRAIGVFGPLQLHLEPLHADLEAVHGLDGGLRAGRVVEAHEA